jgi:hypothetical protein
MFRQLKTQFLHYKVWLMIYTEIHIILTLKLSIHIIFYLIAGVFADISPYLEIAD